MNSASPHGTDDPREIVDELDTRARAEATPEGAAEEERAEGSDLAAGERHDDVSPSVPGSPEPPD